MLAIESLAFDSLAVGKRDKGSLQIMSVMTSVSDCGVPVTRAASYDRPSDLRLTGHGRAGGSER
jgi:hypothetical protein